MAPPPEKTAFHTTFSKIEFVLLTKAEGINEFSKCYL